MQLRATVAISLLLLLTAASRLPAEEFRANPKELVTVTPEDTEGVAVPLLLGDLLYISAQDPHAFIEGVELEVKPPAAAVRESFSISVTIHHASASFPGPGAALISGDTLLEEELRPANRYFYRLPLRGGVHFQPQADTTVVDSTIALSEERPITIGFWPRMKGLPSAIQEGSFLVTVRPVLANRGGARVDLLDERTNTPISLDEAEPYLEIDGEAVPIEEEIHFLPAGLHRIRFESSRYMPGEATFAVEPGQINRVRMRLKTLTTEVAFSLPEETEVYFNGNPVDHGEGVAELPVGEHLVVLELGGFTVQRTITLEAGRTYELGLDLDVFLKEN